MRKITRIIIIVFLITITTINISAQNRVIYSFDQITDDTGFIKLKWSEKDNGFIRITEIKQINDKKVQVKYRSNGVSQDFSKVQLCIPNVNLPVEIILVDENQREVILKDLDKDDVAYYSILNLYHRGFINGFPDNTFKGEQNITREQFAKMIVDVAEYKLKADVKSTYSDVPQDKWSRKYIMTLTDKGLISGTQGKFEPERGITFGEASALISKTFKFYTTTKRDKKDVDTPHWSDSSIHTLLEADVLKITDKLYDDYKPEKVMTRREAALLLSRVLLLQNDPA